METLSRNSTMVASQPLDLSRSLTRSPTIELLDEKLPKSKTSSFVSLIANAMQVASLPRVSIGSFFKKHKDTKSTDVQDLYPSLNRDAGPHDDGYHLLDLQPYQAPAQDIAAENQEAEIACTEAENTEGEVPTVADEVHSNVHDEGTSQDEVNNNEMEENVHSEIDVVKDSQEEKEESGDLKEDNLSEVEESEMDDDNKEGNGNDESEEGDETEEKEKNQNEDTAEDNEMQDENEIEMSEENHSVYRGPPPIEVAISFDTTGSMSSLLEPLRANITNVCERLFADVPNLRIAIIAHGDYCDEEEFYLMKAVDFTQDFGALRTFLNETDGTGGGDFAECYEYVLNKVGQLNWTPGTQRALIMIGDAVPHEVNSPDNKMGLDWRQEVSKLYHEMGISVYSVQCKEEEGADTFWRELAERASGRYLQLSEFDNVVQLIMAICYREKDPMMFGAFEHEVRHHVGGGMTQDLQNMFEVLRDGPASSGPGGVVMDDAVAGPSHATDVVRPMKRKHSEISRPEVSSSPAKKIRKTPLKAKRILLKTSYIEKRATKKTILKPAVSSARSPVSTTSKRSKRFMRHEKGRLVAGRIARERVPETRFLLGGQTWSPWKLAVSEEQIDSSWMPCRKGRSGFRNTNLFKHNNRSPALYEFAVQPGTSRKRYPVYLRATTGFRNSLKCDTYFLRHNTILDLVEDAISRNYQVYVRRLVVQKPITVSIKPRKVVKTDNVRLLSQMMFKEYDYSWNINKYASSGARPIKF